MFSQRLEPAIYVVLPEPVVRSHAVQPYEFLPLTVRKLRDLPQYLVAKLLSRKPPQHGQSADIQRFSTPVSPHITAARADPQHADWFRLALNDVEFT